jgi:glyoxylase-like metal-dependent hydrolase (beta-lactamase superfamily II)
MDWFSSRVISPGVTLITEPFVHPFFRANLYRIEGRDRDVQFDFGNGLASLSAAFPKSERPMLAIASHAHVDHIGSFHEYMRRAGHALEADVFATMNDEGTFASWLVKLNGAVEHAPHAGWSMADYALEPAPLTETLADGDIVDLGDRKLRVLHLPGHSPGSIGLLDERNGEFFPADAIYDDVLIDDLLGSSVPDYLKTMARLADLDVHIVHPGHGGSFGRQRMHQIARDYIRSEGG